MEMLFSWFCELASIQKIIFDEAYFFPFSFLQTSTQFYASQIIILFYQTLILLLCSNSNKTELFSACNFSFFKFWAAIKRENVDLVFHAGHWLSAIMFCLKGSNRNSVILCPINKLRYFILEHEHAVKVLEGYNKKNNLLEIKKHENIYNLKKTSIFSSISIFKIKEIWLDGLMLKLP